MLVHGADRRGSLAHCGRDPLHRATPNVTDREEARLARLERQRCAVELLPLLTELVGLERPVGAQGFGQLRGRIEPTIVEGRAPVALDEVALGAETLAAAGRAVGDRVRITGSSARTFRVVGQVVLTGRSRLRFSGRWIVVDGLRYRESLQVVRIEDFSLDEVLSAEGRP